MRFLAKFSPKESVGLDRILPLVDEEEKLAWRFYREGFVREFFMTGTPGTIVVTGEAPNEEEIHRRFAELPMVKADVIDYELIQLRPFTNWETLFSPEVIQSMEAR